MKTLNVSRSQLAAVVGVDKSEVSRWLSGSGRPSDHNLARISDVLARMKPGFNMTVWEKPRPEFEAFLGIEPAVAPAPSEGEASPARGATGPGWLRLRPRTLVYAAAVLVALGAGVALTLLAAGVGQSRAAAEATDLTRTASGLMHERNRPSYARAEQMLRRAVALDPDYAPAWAKLGVVTWLPWWWGSQDDPDDKARIRAESLACIRRALKLSPNLPQALGAMGMVLNDERQGQAWNERAVRLDPDDVELWMWLGEARLNQSYDLQGAFEAFSRARALDPAWQRIDDPYIRLVGRLQGSAAAYVQLDQIKGLVENQVWPLQMRSNLEFYDGRLADAAADSAAVLRTRPKNLYAARLVLMRVAAALDDRPLLARTLAREPLLRPVYDSFARNGEAYARAQSSPNTWWERNLVGAEASALVAEGRSPVLVGLYDQRFGRPVKFMAQCPCDPLAVGPALVLALRQAGRRAEADQLYGALSESNRRLEDGHDHKLETAVTRARLLALAGDGEAATARLREAVSRGWMGQSPEVGADPETDPVFAALKSRPDFQAAVAMFRRARRVEAIRLSRADLTGAP
jgi:tetratricopeptide (TPR) repeat protein